MRHEKVDETDAIGWFTNEHLRMSGAYWCIGSLKLIHKLDFERTKQSMVQFVKECQNEDGGFGGNTGIDSHASSSLYALLVLSMFDSIDSIDLHGLAKYMASLQNKDGSFKGDADGEVDTRFSYCVVSCLSLLGKLDLIDT